MFRVKLITAALLSCLCSQLGYANEDQRHTDPKAILPPIGKVPETFLILGGGEYFPPYAFLVDKSRRTLTLWKNSGHIPELVAAYPTDMGKKSGDKMLRGDHRTPEGIYFFQKKLEGIELDYSQYGIRAFTMDYPNFFDQYENKTGDGIWLHAIPDTETLVRGSRGCVVVRNTVIEKLTPYISLKKTPIIVADTLEYVDPSVHKTRMEKINLFLSGWKTAWENEKIDDYIQFYSDSFRSLGMNKRRWRRYKSGLNEKYDNIKVDLRNPMAYFHKGEIIVRFLQAYQSSQFADFGEKKLFIKKENGEFKILGEQWVAVDNSMVAKSLSSKKDNDL